MASTLIGRTAGVAIKVLAAPEDCSRHLVLCNLWAVGEVAVKLSLLTVRTSSSGLLPFWYWPKGSEVAP